MASRRPKETHFRTDWIGNLEDPQGNRRGTQHAARLRTGDMEERDVYDTQGNPSVDGVEQVLIDDTTQAKHLTDTVSLNVPVVVRDLYTDEEITFTIVDCEAADPNQNRLSFASPIGFALLWKRIGDVVKVHLPQGEAHYRIIGLAAESFSSLTG